MSSTYITPTLVTFYILEPSEVSLFTSTLYFYLDLQLYHSYLLPFNHAAVL